MKSILAGWLHNSQLKAIVAVVFVALLSLAPCATAQSPFWNGFTNLLYDSNTGTVQMYMGAYQGTFTTNTTWTQIIAGNFGGESITGNSDFLFYDQNSGTAEFYACARSGLGLELTLINAYSNWSPGYSIIVPGNFGGTSTTGQTDLLMYNSITGNASFFEVPGKGNLQLMKSSTWSAGHTMIVPGDFGGKSLTGQTDLMIYDNISDCFILDFHRYCLESADASFYDVSGQGNINLMQRISFLPGTTSVATPGWTQIIPGNFGGVGQTDLLCYNAATGLTEMFDTWGQGNTTLLNSYSNWNPGQTVILPGDFGKSETTGQSDLMTYDASTGNAEFFDVSGHGNLNSFTSPEWNFPSGQFSLVVNSFVVRPVLSGFKATMDQTGVTFVLSGSNLTGTHRVIIGCNGDECRLNGVPDYTSQDLSFSVISSTTIDATMANPNLQSGYFEVVTPLGSTWGGELFRDPYTRSTSVTVPNVIGQSLQTAEQMLQQDGLRAGTSATGSNLVVVSQSPGPGSQVSSGSTVNLTVATAPSGFSAVTLTNYLQSGSGVVYVWLYNESTGSWTLENGGNLLGYGDSVTVGLSSQSYYIVTDVDPSLSLCPDNDPTNVDCIVWQWQVPGNPSGPAYAEYMY